MIHLNHCGAKSNKEQITFQPTCHSIIAWGTETSRNAARIERIVASSLQAQLSYRQEFRYHLPSALCDTKLVLSEAELARKGRTTH